MAGKRILQADSTSTWTQTKPWPPQVSFAAAAVVGVEIVAEIVVVVAAVEAGEIAAAADVVVEIVVAVAVVVEGDVRAAV